MNYRLLLAGIGLILMVAACAPEPQLLNDNYLDDDSFITGDPCEAPCWRDITPGETSWQDARTIIEDDDSLDDLQTQSEDDTDRIGAAWAQADGDLCCQMFSSDDGETVDFLILQTAPDEELEAVFEVYNEPTYLIGETLADDQGLFSLFYPEVPMLIYAFVEGEGGELSETSEVIGFAYMTAELMQELIDTSELHAWEGFASYQDYMDGEFEVTPIPDADSEDE